MLFLIGLGLSKGDVSLKGLNIAKNADKLLLDPYTNKIEDEYIKFLEEETGKKILLLERSDLEENAGKTIEEAENKNIAILVSGDPLIATTHHTILDLAMKKRIKTSIIHSSSIFSAAIGVSGLDLYRFGPTTTIPFWSEKYKPTSFLDVIEKNIKNNEHTLVLLDYNYKQGRGMSLEEALSLLEKAEEAKGIKIIDKMLVLANVGKEDEDIVYADKNSLIKIKKRFNGKILSLIIPSNPNFAEEEALSKYVISNI